MAIMYLYAGCYPQENLKHNKKHFLFKVETGQRARGTSSLIGIQRDVRQPYYLEFLFLTLIRWNTNRSPFLVLFNKYVFREVAALATSQMSGAAFPSPTVEMAEINRIQYELEYTEGISQKMRIPQMLKVAPHSHDEPGDGLQEVPPSVTMQVPDRIVIAGDAADSHFPRPRDLDLIQSTPLESLALKTPPRVLTLSDQPLYFLEEEHQTAPDTEEVVQPQGRLRRERSASENAAVRQLTHNESATTSHPPTTNQSRPSLNMAEEHNVYSASGVLSFIQSTTRRAYQQVLEVLDENPHSKPSLRGGSGLSSNPLPDSRFALSTNESSLEGPADDMTAVDATTLRRQLIKLNKRLKHLEDENKERAKREMIMYSISVAFWLVNTWVWMRR